MHLRKRVSALVFAAVLAVALFNIPAVSQTESDATPQSADEVARKLANPNAAMGVLSFLTDFINYGGDLPGAGKENAFKLTFQPSLPKPLGEGLNLFVRPLIPLILHQPVPDGAGGFVGKGVELGDISFDCAIGKNFPGGLILVGGIVGSIPTATHDALGLNQWLLGPEVFAGYLKKWGVVGLLLTHSWNIAGSNKSATSITGGQYFYVINLGNAWQLSAQPTWSYNHNAKDGGKWTFPLGTGVNKTLIMGKTPWKISLQYWYYVASPEAFGPRHHLRLSISPVIPLPW